MEQERILKQITITEKDITDLVQTELFNSGLLEGMDSEVIKKIDEFATFELIQSYCNNNIEPILKSFKIGLDNMELEEFKYWFGFDSEGYLEELTRLSK